jgi:hypothetical protein
MRSLKDLRRVIDAIPRPAFLGIVVLFVTAALFAMSFFMLGGARDSAVAEGKRLQNEITKITSAITRSRNDQEYLDVHLARYEELIKSDKLIPHTRRAALTALRAAAEPHGLADSLNFTFTAGTGSVAAAQSQPTSGAYKVSVETIALKIAAPLDGAIFRLIDDVNRTFPGSVVLESMTLERPLEVNEAALSDIGRGSSSLVTGEVTLSWRTAQKEEDPKAKAKP